ncbi:hypothetical protein ACJJI5_09750 [Microbulbifer sp. EKSA008]|uniref:hypothetical protein n=1 Tax=unclassified Microbulbifer TaxID=2619833 RepID=UPI00403A1D86
MKAHGAEELSHHDKGFYIAGIKSYGRAPTFLMLTGYEQVRSIADELAGNYQAARRLELNFLGDDTSICQKNENRVCAKESAASNCC